MPKTRGSAQPNLSNHEWDFRPVSKDELDDARFYEYGREREDICSPFEGWHRQKIGNRRSRVSVLHVLEQIDAGDGDWDLRDAVTKTLPPWSEEDHMRRLLMICPRFPRPFLSLDVRSRRARMDLYEVEPSFRILHSLPKFTERDRKRRLQDGEIYVVAKILARRGVTSASNAARDEIRRICENWRKLVGPQRADEFLKTRGGGPKEHWSWLRDLAAFRLSRHGLSYKDASQFISEQTGERIADKHQFLPYYKSPGRWTEAIDRAKARIKAWPDFE